MEPNKLEQDFKNKLEQRTIQPSGMAWDRLDAMLSVAEKKKKRPNRTWMYVAAGFLVFLLAGILFLNQEKESNNGIIKNEDAVVTTKQHPAKETITEDNIQITGEAVVVQPQTSKETKRRATNSNKASNSTDIRENVQSPVVSEEVIAATDKKEIPDELSPLAETENLMAASLRKDGGKKKASVKVDPNALLSSVEGELNETYRNKTLQGVIKNFNVVKTAVANRNYE